MMLSCHDLSQTSWKRTTIRVQSKALRISIKSDMSKFGRKKQVKGTPFLNLHQLFYKVLLKNVIRNLYASNSKRFNINSFCINKLKTFNKSLLLKIF